MTETESMVVRVAKAIGTILYGYVDPVDTPNTWATSLEAARAAIEAMKTPTTEMKKAGEDAMPDGLRWSPEYGDAIDEYDPAPVWSAMIVKALEE